MHVCSNSITRIATHFVDACLHQLDGKHSYLLVQPLQKLHQLRCEYVTAKKIESPNVPELRARWDAEHAEISQFLANGIRLAERKLLLTIGFRNLHTIGHEWSVFQKVENTMELNSKPGWTSPINPYRDVDLMPYAATMLSPRQVAIQFMLQSACSSQAQEKHGPCALAMAAIKAAVSTKDYPLGLPKGSNVISTVLDKVDLFQKVTETEVSECWKYALKANQVLKQTMQMMQGPAPVACQSPHSPPGPTKISPNLSTISSSTPLSASPSKRCRWTDSEDADPGLLKAPRTESPRTAQATPANRHSGRPTGIDPACRPEHEQHRHTAARRSAKGRPSAASTKQSLPPSPESLEEGELRSP